MNKNPKNQKLNGLLMKIGGAYAGYAALEVAVAMGPQVIRDNSLYVGAAAAVGGGYIAMQAKDPFMEGVGVGVAVAGTKHVVGGLAKMAGVNIPGISGINDTAMAGINEAYMAGYYDAQSEQRTMEHQPQPEPEPETY